MNYPPGVELLPVLVAGEVVVVVEVVVEEVLWVELGDEDWLLRETVCEQQPQQKSIFRLSL